MAADIFTPAVLGYIDHGAFPQEEDVASATLTPHSLQQLSTALKKEQDTVKDEIRSLSKSTAGDVDTWISRAKELQADIQRSRDTARRIVEEHEGGRELKVREEDKKRTVELLEKEVEFNVGVVRSLEGIKEANVVLERAREALVKGDVGQALGLLEKGEQNVGRLSGEDGVGVKGVMNRKIDKLQHDLREAVLETWNQGVSVDVPARRVAVKKAELEKIVTEAKKLELFDGLVLKLSEDVERAIVRPRLFAGRNGQVPRIKADGGHLTCEGNSDDSSLEVLLRDLRLAFEFFDGQLPKAITVPLSQSLLPALMTRLEEDWLEATVPLEIDDMPAFQQLLSDVNSFADSIDSLGWSGSGPLRSWTQAAPRTWLTKKREALLGEVRNLSFTGLRVRKTVERVETQMISKDDTLAAKGGDDEWDTAWDEPNDVNAAAAASKDPSTQAEEEEDMSAWDEEPEVEQSPQNSAAAPSASTGDEEDMSAWDDEPEGPVSSNPAHLAQFTGTAEEEDAWGWGDGDEPHAPASPNTPKKQKPNGEKRPSKPAEREMTLRETFTVTAIPDDIIELIRQVIMDAETLAAPEHSSSPIAPAAAALYTLPTLALAIYRATAPTAYAKIDVGNMLIYNDASRLSDSLRAWQAERPPSSRLRLDNDVKALEQFAKRAYSTEMESQRTILRDHLDGAQGFSNCSQQPFKSECEDAINQTILRLKDVQNLWSPVLSQSALLQSIGSLLSTITTKILHEIEDLPDIGESDSLQLKSLCTSITHQVTSIFTQTAPDGEQRDMTFVYCPNWLKFQYLGEILEASLADIRYLWKEGELSLEFEREEVVGLIEALFAESTHRRQAIQEIRRGGR